MPAILTDDQIRLAYDMETVAEALAAGYVLPPDPRSANYAAKPPKLATENDLTYRDRVEVWRKAENDKIAGEAQAANDADEQSRQEWQGGQAAAQAEMQRAAAMDTSGDIVDLPTTTATAALPGAASTGVITGAAEIIPPADADASAPFPGKDVYGAD